MIADFVHQYIEPYFNYWVYVIIMMIGLWAVIAKNNLIKKLIGLAIFQTAIILFYVSIGVKDGATIPILGDHGTTPPTANFRLTRVPPSATKHEHIVLTDQQTATADSSSKPGKKASKKIDQATIANPLPHVLMLTAIVVGVATLGVALAIAQMIFKEFGTLEEDEILNEIKTSTSDG